MAHYIRDGSLTPWHGYNTSLSIGSECGEENIPQNQVLKSRNPEVLKPSIFNFGQAGMRSPGPSELIGVVAVKFRVGIEKIRVTKVGVCFWM